MRLANLPLEMEIRNILSVQYSPMISHPFLLARQHRHNIAPTLRMPPREHKVLRVLPLQRLAHLTAEWIITPLHLHAHHKRDAAPAVAVGSPVGHVRLGTRQPHRVLVAAAVLTSPGMVRCGPLAQLQVPLGITHTTKQTVGLRKGMMLITRLPIHSSSSSHSSSYFVVLSQSHHLL